MTDVQGKTAFMTRLDERDRQGDGADVLVVGRDEQRAKEVLAEIEGTGGTDAVSFIRGVTLAVDGGRVAT